MTRFRLIVILALLSACDSSRVFEDFQAIENKWSTDQTITFPFEVTDVQVPYNLIIHFKQDRSFRFHNLYFQPTLATTTDSVLLQNLEEIFFFDPKSGEPLGRGIGGSFDHQYLWKAGFKFPRNGSYQLELRQFMRIDSLDYVNRVGFRLEKALD